jgi:hypothetical protein
MLARQFIKRAALGGVVAIVLLGGSVVMAEEEEGGQFGACCFADGTCQVIERTDCDTMGGDYQGTGTTCVPGLCPGPTGACCLPDGSCDVLAASECDVALGLYQGDGTVCLPGFCPTPIGACCFPDESCSDGLVQTECNAAGGGFQGVGTTCSPDLCVLQLGACCFLGGTCGDLTAMDCAGVGGAFEGGGTSCATFTCPDDPGRADGTTKGSLLFFNKVEIKWRGDAAVPPVTPALLAQDTFISLTNDYPDDVLVQMYFVNGDPPLDPVFDGAGQLIERGHTGWNAVDNLLQLTANEPTYWSALTCAPKGVSPFTVLDPGGPATPGRPCPECGPGYRCLRGYIIAWAVNAANEQIRWNHLKGEATLVNYRSQRAWEYNAYAHAVVAGTPLDNGEPVGTPGTLRLDGVEYAPSFDLLLLNFQAVGSAAFSSAAAGVALSSDTDLTLHPVPVDLRQNSDGPVTTKASFDVWNMNEVKFSGTHRCLTCWDQTLLSRYDAPNHFLRPFLQTEHGKARIDGHAADVCNVFDDPDTPEDESVTSVAAPLLGVAARLIRRDGAPLATMAAGTNLVGMGIDETAVVRYDPSGVPPEGRAGAARTRRDAAHDDSPHPRARTSGSAHR